MLDKIHNHMKGSAMNKSTKLVAAGVLAAAFTMAGCTDASWGKLTAYGDNANVQCYSGGTLIFDSVSTGKVISEANSDGYYFKDKKTGKMMEVSGDCIITYDP